MSFHPFLILKKGLKQQQVGIRALTAGCSSPRHPRIQESAQRAPQVCSILTPQAASKIKTNTLHNYIPQKNAYEKHRNIMKPET